MSFQWNIKIITGKETFIHAFFNDFNVLVITFLSQKRI